MLLMPGVKGKRWRSSRARARRGKPCSSIARSARVRSHRSLKRRAAAGVGRQFILFSPTERRALNSETLRRFHGWLVKPVRSASLLARFAPASQSLGADAPRARDAAPKLEGVQVLLAEDNEISRRVALKHLERHGARVTCAGDGAEACRLANESSYDAIILDIRMPVLDGLAAARRIRGTEGLAAERR